MEDEVSGQWQCWNQAGYWEHLKALCFLDPWQFKESRWSCEFDSKLCEFQDQKSQNKMKTISKFYSCQYKPLNVSHKLKQPSWC